MACATRNSYLIVARPFQFTTVGPCLSDIVPLAIQAMKQFHSLYLRQSIAPVFSFARQLISQHTHLTQLACISRLFIQVVACIEIQPALGARFVAR